MNVTVRNVITSMRLLSMINWAEFFESVSPVDAILRGGSDFAAMDFTARDLYRRAIEEIARESGRDEVEVTQRALTAAKCACDIPRISPPTYVATAIQGIILSQTVAARSTQILNAASPLRRGFSASIQVLA